MLDKYNKIYTMQGTFQIKIKVKYCYAQLVERKFSFEEVFREMIDDEFYRPRIEDVSAMALNTCQRK